MTIAFISHPDCLLHNIGLIHPEQSARLTAIDNELERCGLKAILKQYIAPLVTQEQLLRVHDAHYVNEIFTLSPTL